MFCFYGIKLFCSIIYIINISVKSDNIINISNKSDLEPLSLHLSDEDDLSRDDVGIDIKDVDDTDRDTLKVKVNINPHPIVDLNMNNLRPSQPRHFVKVTYFPAG